MKIRRAQESDAAELTRIAHEAKRHWGYPERWIELWRDDLTLSPEFVAGNAVRVGEVRSGIDGQPRVRPLLHLRLS